MSIFMDFKYFHVATLIFFVKVIIFITFQIDYFYRSFWFRLSFITVLYRVSQQTWEFSDDFKWKSSSTHAAFFHEHNHCSIPALSYRVSQKKVWLPEPGEKLYLFCATLLYGVFSIFYKNSNFSLVFHLPKKIREPFFLSKSKVQKSKNVYINYFNRNLKFYKDWITESLIDFRFW